MKVYGITGMSCAACCAKVEKAVLGVPGVISCNVNLLTNSLSVEGNVTDESIIAAVTAAGYGALAGDSHKFPDNSDCGPIVKRLIVSAFLLAVLMYISMGHNMFAFPLPDFANAASIGITEMVLSLAVMVINGNFFVKGFSAVLRLSPNMDTLVALGSASAFIYSSYRLIYDIAAQSTETTLKNLYFESAAMILTLITVGKFLEAKSKGKTTSALKSLMDLVPKTATVFKDGKEMTVPISKLTVGDIFSVKPGSSFPADGTVIYGECSCDESMLTGESIPTDKQIGSKVNAATICRSGYVRCECVQTGENTALAKIIKTVSDATATKAPIARIADKVALIFVPAVISIAIITLLVWTLLGYDFGFSLSRAISVLVISCPCALGLATPVAITVGSGVGAKNGILFKSAEAIEISGKITSVVFDKTGTLTEGMPTVTDIYTSGNLNENELLQYAAGIEAKSAHPLAVAIVNKAREYGVPIRDTDDFISCSGAGVSGICDGKKVSVGNIGFISDKCSVDSSEYTVWSDFAKTGKTPLFVCIDESFCGFICISDKIKSDSKKTIEDLNKHNIETIMMSGDNEFCTGAVANTLGIKKYFADIMPEKKASEIADLQKNSVVAMVGDGINDAPALTKADLGIAIGAGTDIAIESADVVLMKSTPYDALFAILLGKAALKNIKENLFWAFFYNIICIPIAAGVLFPLGIVLNPMIAAAAMSLSSICVVTNALRLNLFKIKANKEDTERYKMIKTFNVKGMMCPHCEATVKQAIEALPQVSEVKADHKTGAVEVTLREPLNSAVITNIITDKGYEVIG